MLKKTIDMKRILVLFILSYLLLLFATCKKDEPEGDYFGYCKFTVNGQEIRFNKCTGNILYNNSDSITFSFKKWDGLILKESIGFFKAHKNIAIRQKVYKIELPIVFSKKLTSVFSTLSDDGDVLCDVYNVLESDSLINNITITSYNERTRKIKGTFEVTYIIDTSGTKCRATAPDTLRIRNGEFCTKIF